MLSRNVKRALLDSRLPLPPTFLLPWAASLTTVSHATEASNIPPPLTNAANNVSSDRPARHPSRKPLSVEQPPPPRAVPQLASARATTSPLALSESVRELLPVLQAQGPHYITAHLYDRPYLLTQGDTLRLPFHMKGVEPGDVLRLNRASNLGSREYTLKAAAPAPKLRSATTTSTTITDPTTGDLASESIVMAEPGMPLPLTGAGQQQQVAPHFIPHIAKGKVSYLDERLFVCRAVVMGVECEPLRIKEKTKRRQRKIKKVKSKHRFTILKVKEVRVRSLEEVESGRDLE